MSLRSTATTQTPPRWRRWPSPATPTSPPCRSATARALDLHLARLRAGSQALYGQALPDEAVLAHLRAAIQAGPPDLSLTATVYSPPVNSPSPVPARARACWSTAAPSSGPAGPCRWRWSSTNACCPVKHVGEVAKTYLLREAASQGHDDAAFVDRHGRLSEATIWNLAFWDGESVGVATGGDAGRHHDGHRAPAAGPAGRAAARAGG